MFCLQDAEDDEAAWTNQLEPPYVSFACLNSGSEAVTAEYTRAARAGRRTPSATRFLPFFQATVFAMEWCVSRKPRRLPRPFVPEIFLSWVSTLRKVSRSPWTRHPPAPPSIARPAHPAGIAPDIEADIHPRPSHPRTPATTRATWKTTSSASPSEDVSNT